MDKRNKDNFFKKHNMRWVTVISLWTFLLAIVFSLITEKSVNNLGLISSFIILLLIIFLGIFFDIIGIAVTRAEEKPFHSMAARKIDEAKIAIKLVRNAGQVSNFCNDVVGDISGIVSGAVGATLIFKLNQLYDFKEAWFLSILITALIASLTVGGKALGKSIALINYERIIIQLAKVLNYIETKLSIEFFPNEKSKNREAR